MIKKLWTRPVLRYTIYTSAIMAVILQQLYATVDLNSAYRRVTSAMEREQAEYESTLLAYENIKSVRGKIARQWREIQKEIPLDGDPTRDFRQEVQSILAEKGIVVVSEKREGRQDRYGRVYQPYEWQLAGRASNLRQALTEIDNLPRLVDWVEVPTGLREAEGDFTGELRVMVYFFKAKDIPFESKKSDGEWHSTGEISAESLPTIWLPPFLFAALKAKEQFQDSRAELLSRRKLDVDETEVLLAMHSYSKEGRVTGDLRSFRRSLLRRTMSLDNAYLLAAETDPAKKELLRDDILADNCRCD